MIRYNLNCSAGHSFDSWFSDSGAYDKQVRRKLITCPQCGSTKVEKAIMAPRIASAASDRASDDVALMSAEDAQMRTELQALRERVTKTSKNVGKRFAEEARKMHYGEMAHRSIYGTASLDEARGLAEEGIAFQALPNLPDDRN